MAPAPTTSPTSPSCAVRLVGSARPRQNELPTASCAAAAAQKTITRLAATAQAACRSAEDGTRRALVEVATSALTVPSPPDDGLERTAPAPRGDRRGGHERLRAGQRAARRHRQRKRPRR